jgi:hypothetical protein
MPPAPLRTLLAAVAALACASAGQPGAPAPRPDRVVVAPFDLALRTPAELRGREPLVWPELLRYLGTRDRKLAVVDADDAARLWQAAILDLERSGAAREPRAAAAGFARRVADHVDYDVLVLPALVVRRARVGGYHAFWDGVRRDLPARTPLPLALDEGISGVEFSGYRGSIAAASLYVALFAPDGALLYEGLAGLDVIQEAARVARPHDAPVWTLAPRRDLFADAAELREGIERAFERRLPRTANAW